MRAHGRHEDARRIKMVAQMVTTKGLELVFVDNTTVEDTIQSQIARMFYKRPAAILRQKFGHFT